MITVVDNQNNVVTTQVVWGDGASFTLSTNGYVRAGGKLTLNVTDLSTIVSNGFYIEVEHGGTLSYREWVVTGEPGKKYRLSVPSAVS